MLLLLLPVPRPVVVIAGAAAAHMALGRPLLASLRPRVRRCAGGRLAAQ
jgi:hypothetical protein